MTKTKQPKSIANERFQYGQTEFCLEFEKLLFICDLPARQLHFIGNISENMTGVVICVLKYYQLAKNLLYLYCIENMYVKSLSLT